MANVKIHSLSNKKNVLNYNSNGLNLLETIRSKSNPNEVYILDDNILTAIDIQPNGHIAKKWDADLQIDSINQLKNDRVSIVNNYVFVNNFNAVKTFKIGPNGLQLHADYSKTDKNDFRSIHSPQEERNFLYGTFSQNGILGILFQDGRNGIKIFEIDGSELADPNNYPIYALEGNENNPSIYADIQARGINKDISVGIVKSGANEPETFVVRDNNGLKLYRVDGDSEIDLLFTLNGIMGPFEDRGENELILFANVTGRRNSFRDVILRNKNGLYLYEYVGNGYKLINHNPMFSNEKGWNDPTYLRTMKTFDTTGDGKDDLIFTGPQGMEILSYDPIENVWNTLLDTNNLSAGDRHARVLDVIKTDKIRLLTQNAAGGIDNWTLEASPPSTVPPMELESNDKKTPNKEYPIPSHDLMLPLTQELPLRDMIDYSFLKNNVEAVSGNSKFSIPLMNSILKYFSWYTLSYDGTSDTSTILGKGWSVPEQQIVLNDQGSVFPEDHRYYLATTDNVLELYHVKSESWMDSKNETQTKMHFTLVGTDLIDKNSDEITSNIVYDVVPKKWTVKINGNKYIYGTETGTGYDVKWENWRKRGRSSYDQIRVPKVWNLVEIFDSNDKSVAIYSYDRYEEIADPETENTFTQGMYLTSIAAPLPEDAEEDEEPEWKVTFEYANKTAEEIEKIEINDGNLETFTSITKYLTGYNLFTDEFTQTILFDYDVRGKQRYLTKISQKDEQYPILTFKYNSNGFLTEIDSPNNMKATMAVESMIKRKTLDSANKVRTEEIDIEDNVYHHSDYMLLTYLKTSSNEADDRKIVLKVMSPDAKKELFQVRPFGMNNISEYRVSVTDNLFYILLISRKNKKRELWVFLKNEDNKTWNPNPSSYILGERALVRGGRDFVVYTDVILPSTDKGCYQRVVLPPSGRKPDPPQHKLVLLEYKKGKLDKTELIDSKNLDTKRMLSPAEMEKGGFTIQGKLYPSEIKEELLLASTAEMFVHYADPYIILSYRDQFGHWEHRPVADMGKQYRRTLDTFLKFDVNCDRKKFLMMLYKETALQMNDNIIISYRLMLDDKSDLYTNARIAVLGSDHRFRRREEFNQLKDHIESFSIRQNTLEYTYKFDNKTEQFKIDVDMPEKKEKSQDDYDVLKQVQEQMDRGFLLNIREYLATIESGKYTQNSTVIEFNGSKWEELTDVAETVKYPVIQKLTDKFKLEQQQADGRIILREIDNEGRRGDRFLDVNNLGMIVTSLPNYIAYKTDRYGLKFQRFNTRGGISSEAESLPNEKLSPFCNSKLIITYGEAGNGQNSGRSIIFREIEQDIDTEVVSLHTLRMNNGFERKTAFEYFDEQISGSNVYFPKVFIKPGNYPPKFGYIEQITNFENRTLSYTNIRDARGQIVKREEASQQNQGNNEEFNKNIRDTTLFDKEKEAEIVQFFPYYQSDDEVDYYGFESYETKQPAKHLFDENDVQPYQFPLTGIMFLQLGTGKKFTSVYTPKNQENVYKASSWIRKPNVGFKLGTLSPNFKANIYSGQNYVCTVLSKVKSRLEDWFLLEVMIDMTYLKEFDSQSKNLRPNIVITNEKSSARTPVSNNELRIELSISPSKDETVDVDHILFAPINLRSIVNVYSPKLWTLTAQITTTGLIKKFLYDAYNNDLAVVNEYNQVTEINAFTKLTTQLLNGNRFQETADVTVTGKRGIYETFSDYAYKNRWELENPEAWILFTNIIHHAEDSSDKISLRSDFKKDSICIRFDYNLDPVQNSKLVINNDLVLEHRYITFGRERLPMQTRGELIYILEKDRVFVFVDGLLYFDNKQVRAEGITLELTGFTSVSKVVILEDPLVSITYTTPLDDELQKVQLIGHDKATVRSYEIDEIGRKIKETLPETIQMNPNQPLLGYNRNITPDRVKHRRIIYQADSLDQIRIMDIPNSEFTEEKGTGRMFYRYDEQEIPAYISAKYPIIKEYSYQVEMKGGEIRDLNVYNNKRQKIAQCLYVPRVNGILSTYEYNEKGQLETTLTPAYHKLAGTTLEKSFPPSEIERLKKNLAFHFSYTESGKPKIYQGPDSGKRLSLYNKQDLLKFFVNYEYKDDNRIASVSYFNYDEINRLISTGYINNPERLTVEYLEKLTETYLSKEVNPNVVEYQKFEYDDLEEDPFLRENVKRVVTLTKDYPFAEEFVTNMRKHVLTRRIYLPLQSNKDLQSIEMTKQYTEAGDLVDRINYPYEHNGNLLKIQLRYNKLNQIVGITGPDGDLCNFEYNAEGGVSKEIRSPNKPTQFERTYKFNELGSFTQISDKFLDEDLTYTQPGYGNFGFGDGTMTSTTYNAKWHKAADESELKLNEQSFGKVIGPENSKKCFNALKQTGHINSENYQEKIFYEADSQIPATCYEKRSQISKAINQNTFPKTYGHSYDFGNQKELTKAKYFVGKNNVKPLQMKTLESLYRDQARGIWEKLKRFNFILEDNLQIEVSTAQAKKGMETLANPNIQQDISRAVGGLDQTFVTRHGKSIEQLLLQSYLDGKRLSLNDFEKFIDYEKKNTNTINAVWNVIQSKYLRDPTNPKLRQIFDANNFQAAIKLLNQHFTTEILQDEADTESGLLDEHGNHKIFYVGSNYRQLDYEENSNRVKTVYMSEAKNFAAEMKHDSQGNVIKAEHKKIKNIEYDKVISKISQIEMEDGRVIKFNYDSRTDRIAKRVFGSNGKLTKEINYIRDENGKCLVQREVVYFENSSPMITMTAYVYGPKGLLLGFYRNGEFYNVLTDHEGSTRLIEKNGEIVAAYDYYPYGSTIRVYGKDPNAHIPYRYTGQEWDEETGLYYFIARYYDPEIGRFLQMDPMGQYFSPYKFSGNSPVSLVDPDGEFVFLLVVLVFLVVGAYLGGAAANGNWNPLEWDWTSKETWLGIIGGGIVGATIPFFALQSVAILAAHMPLWAAWTTVAALGVGFAYAEGVKYSGSWNPLEWDYTNPTLINTIFTGFGQGTGFVYSVSGVTSPVAFFKGLSNFKKIAFVATTVGNFGLNVYIEGSAMKWNFKDPQMYIMLLTNAVHAHEGAMMFSKGVGRIGKRFTSLKTHLKSLRTGAKKIGEYLNKDVGKKLLQYTGEVLSGLEVTASKAYDTFNAIDNDEVLWNLAGSRAYSEHVREFLADEKVARRKWQAALFFVPGSHIKKVTGFKQLPTRQLVSNLVKLFSNAKYGQNLNNGLVKVDKFYGAIDLDSSFASKLISALGGKSNLRNIQMVVFSNSDTGAHIVTFMEKGSTGTTVQITDVDDEEFNVNVLSTIDDKLNAIRQECLRIFREISPQLKNDVKVTGFVDKDNSIDALLQKIERKINSNKPFVNSLNKGLKKILTQQTRKINSQILSLRDAVRSNRANEQQKRQLEQLTKQRIQMGSVNERLSKIIDNHSSKLLGIEKILANWIPEKGIENKTITYEETMLPVDYRPTDFIYDEGICATSSHPITKCNWCPETISKNAHSSLNHLRWTEEIDVGSLDTKQGLFYEPTNEWKQSNSRSKRADKSWIVSKLQSCLEYLNLTSAAPETPIWNNRPHIEQDVPVETGTQFTTPDYSMSDVNSTLFLIDMCVRKVTGEKYIGNGNQISLEKAQEMSMNIVEDIEQLLLETINEDLLDLIDFPHLQCRLFETVARGTPSKIPTIVMDSLKDVLKDLTSEERKNIEMYFNKKCN